MIQTDSFLSSLNNRCKLRLSKRAKNLHLKVSAMGLVELVVPKGYSVQHAHAFLLSQKKWVMKQLEHFEKTKNQHPELFESLPNLIHLRALDREWQVNYKIESTLRNKLQAQYDGLNVQAKDTFSARLSLRRWLKRTAKSHLTAKVATISEELNLEYRGISIRSQKTRWGSCSQQKIINLNQNALFLPKEWVRYLCIHELCHTVHLNHSARFWSLIEKFEPRYKILDKNLNKGNQFVPFWALER